MTPTPASLCLLQPPCSPTSHCLTSSPQRHTSSLHCSSLVWCHSLLDADSCGRSLGSRTGKSTSTASILARGQTAARHDETQHTRSYDSDSDSGSDRQRQTATDSDGLRRRSWRGGRVTHATTHNANDDTTTPQRTTDERLDTNYLYCTVLN